MIFGKGRWAALSRNRANGERKLLHRIQQSSPHHSTKSDTELGKTQANRRGFAGLSLRENPATKVQSIEGGEDDDRWSEINEEKALWCTNDGFLVLLLDSLSTGESTSSASDLERSRLLGLPPPPAPGLVVVGASSLSPTEDDFLRPRGPERESTGGTTRSAISTSAGEEGELRVE